MAREAGSPQTAVSRIWRAFGLQPSPHAIFKLSSGSLHASLSRSSGTPSRSTMTILSRSPGRRPLATSWPASNAVACELSTHDTGASGVGCSAAGLCRNEGIAPGLTATPMVNAMRLGPLDEAAQPARRMNNPVLKHGTDGRRIACGSASLWTQTQHQDHDALQHHDQDFERVGVGRAGHVDTACAVMELVHESPQSVQVVVAATHPVVDEGGCKYAQQGAPEGSQPPTRKRRVRGDSVQRQGRQKRQPQP